jgi:hypothetical protein
MAAFLAPNLPGVTRWGVGFGVRCRSNGAPGLTLRLAQSVIYHGCRGASLIPLIVLLLLIGLYLWAQRRDREREQRRELRVFERTKATDDSTVLLKLDLEKMKGTREALESAHAPMQFELRRTSPGHWETRITDEHYRFELRSLEQRIDAEPHDSALRPEYLELLDQLRQAPPNWQPLTPSIVPQVESRYEQLRHEQQAAERAPQRTKR